MTSITKTNRRNFLKAAGGVAAAAVAAPFVWIPRMSRAHLDIPADPRNKVIHINWDGGARSVPMFNGGVGSKFNPFTNAMGNSVHGAAEGVAPHATESDGPEPLEIACFFSPPVVPGSYEKGK